MLLPPGPLILRPNERRELRDRPFEAPFDAPDLHEHRMAPALIRCGVKRSWIHGCPGPSFPGFTVARRFV